MPQSVTRKIRNWFMLFSLLYVVLSYLAIDLVRGVIVQNEVTEEKESLRQQLTIIRSRLEASIYKDTFIADSLATVVTLNPDLTFTYWTTIADKLIQKSGHARNVGLSPNDVISHVYPLQGNERAIGFDFRTNPEQYKTVMLAREKKEVFLAGPVELVQGGTALIARFPIFSDYPQAEDYWGGVSVVLDFMELVESVGLTDTRGLEIAIRGKDGSGADGPIIWGSLSTFDNPDITLPVNLPSGSWLIGAIYRPQDLKDVGYLNNMVILIGWLISIAIYLSIFSLIRAYNIAKSASLMDELTRLPNRRHIMEILNSLMARHGSKTNFTLVNIDLNGFKAVNDTYGHQAGDELLKHVADRLRCAFRISDVVARLGGDEFLVLMHRISDVTEVESKLAEVKTEVESIPLKWRGRELLASLSCGYSCYHGQEITIRELLSEADKKMYEAKRNAQ